MKISLACSAAANDGTLEGSVCVLPFGVTTAPNAYSATIAVGKVGAVGATVTFALTAGSLPPGLSMPAQGTSGTVITGNPTQTGTFNFTIKATDGAQTSTLTYQITITVQGPPDQMQCNAANGSFLISGICVLPDSVLGLPYQGHLVTSHNAGGALSVVAGALPPGLTLRTFAEPTDANNELAGTPATAGTFRFTMRLTDFSGQQATQSFSLTISR